MDIFISWSGPRSRAVAEALKEYLPMIVNAFNPWLSCADMDKGAVWASDLTAALGSREGGYHLPHPQQSHCAVHPF
jgi:hypothetical protein